MVKTRGKDKTKRQVTKPASELQKIQRLFSWFINFRLQFIHNDYTLPMSNNSRALINQHTAIVFKLRASLRQDYQIYKKHILAARKALPAKQD